MNPDNVLFSGVSINEGFSNLGSNQNGRNSSALTSDMELRKALIKSHMENS